LLVTECVLCRRPKQNLLTALYSSLLAVLLTLEASSGQAARLPHREPKEVGLDGQQLQRIHPLVTEAIADKKLPGCVVLIGRRNCIAFIHAYGHRRLLPSLEPMTADTVFDLASLTKPMATATSVMLLVERGIIRLQDPVSQYLPEFSDHGKETITIEQLLSHQGGLIPDNPLDDYRMGKEESWRRINALKMQQPAGKQFVYTDVGFLVLGQLIKKVTSQSVAEFSANHIYRPLGMNETGYLPSAILRGRAATTQQRDGEWLRGVVHDPRAALLGGVAGHAGLFSTAEDMALYANMMLGAGQASGARILSAPTFQEMIRPRNIAGQLRGLGWDSRSKYSSNRGELFSPQAFGHGGFTGTTMWIDPTLDLFVIFLSNRVHPTGEGSVNHLAGRIGTIAAAACSRDQIGSCEEPKTAPCVQEDW
jgi:CubicO group peptidase (beta-lactamase class C family)